MMEPKVITIPRIPWDEDEQNKILNRAIKEMNAEVKSKPAKAKKSPTKEIPPIPKITRAEVYTAAPPNLATYKGGKDPYSSWSERAFNPESYNTVKNGYFISTPDEMDRLIEYDPNKRADGVPSSRGVPWSRVAFVATNSILEDMLGQDSVTNYDASVVGGAMENYKNYMRINPDAAREDSLYNEWVKRQGSPAYNMDSSGRMIIDPIRKMNRIYYPGASPERHQLIEGDDKLYEYKADSTGTKGPFRWPWWIDSGAI